MAGNKVEMAAAEAAKAGRKYERSSIEFPYGDLNDALEVVDIIHKNAGTSCTTVQLAGFLDQSVNGGAFRLKLQAARLFGLLEIDKGNASLTKLGRAAADPSRRNQAKADAFLAVPLYEAIYEKYKGDRLPPAAALQREMAGLGVSSKQASKARQAFERSAEQSGFFNKDKDRLVPPVVRDGIRGTETKPKSQDENELGGGGGGGGGGHPLIRGLFEELPPAKTDWPVAERAGWLETASKIFSLIYKGTGGTIAVSYLPDPPSERPGNQRQ